VTGVQTCALPIYVRTGEKEEERANQKSREESPDTGLGKFPCNERAFQYSITTKIE